MTSQNKCAELVKRYEALQSEANLAKAVASRVPEAKAKSLLSFRHEIVQGSAGLRPAKPAKPAKPACRYGWDCWGRKSGKCCFLHPDKPAKPVESPCRYGWDCWGRENGKCRFLHPDKPAKPAEPLSWEDYEHEIMSKEFEAEQRAEALRHPERRCSYGRNCCGFKNGKCPFIH